VTRSYLPVLSSLFQVSMTTMDGSKEKIDLGASHVDKHKMHDVVKDVKHVVTPCLDISCRPNSPFFPCRGPD
jgi:hypothetical protein